MNVTSLELSKELYELSGWQGASYWWNLTGEEAKLDQEATTTWVLKPAIEGPHKPMPDRYPAYDLGYLLRKLPINTHIVHQYDEETQRHGYRAEGYFGEVDIWRSFIADAPENAAAKLAIYLLKEGTLKGIT
jgi:hypothetical protein